MDNSKLKKPIILIGSARSGTTMMGEILSKHPDIAYWVEPKYIWKYKKPNINDDYRYSKEVTPEISRFIHSKFLSFQIKGNKTRFLEKTPSNCFRVPFIETVFPDAVYINIIRDGRDVSLSAYKKWTQKHDTSAYKRRLKFDDIPIRDLPYYGLEFAKQYFGQRFWPEKLKKWGPVTPEIIEYSNKSIEEACAYQWRESTEVSLNDLELISPDRVLSFKYEDFLNNPESHIYDILEHCELSISEEVIDFAKKNVNPNNYGKWENNELIDRINYILGPLLKRLDYI